MPAFELPELGRQDARGDIAKKALYDLIKHKCVSAYPVLVEQTGNPVAQSEHTVPANHDNCTILTGP